MPPIALVLNLSWGAFLLVWLIGSFRTKRETRRNGLPLGSKALTVCRLLIATGLLVMMRLIATHQDLGRHDLVLFHPTLVSAWAAVTLTVAGLGYAIWARVHLGRNWSPRPSRKEGHELVTSGPYRLVRHPIYTGILMAFVGLLLTGSTPSPVILALSLIIFLRRAEREEQIMMELFPNCYPSYRERTWRLIPYVW